MSSYKNGQRKNSVELVDTNLVYLFVEKVVTFVKNNKP